MFPGDILSREMVKRSHGLTLSFSNFGISITAATHDPSIGFKRNLGINYLQGN